MEKIQNTGDLQILSESVSISTLFTCELYAYCIAIDSITI